MIPYDTELETKENKKTGLKCNVGKVKLKSVVGSGAPHDQSLSGGHVTQQGLVM